MTSQPSHTPQSLLPSFLTPFTANLPQRFVYTPFLHFPPILWLILVTVQCLYYATKSLLTKVNDHTGLNPINTFRACFVRLISLIPGFPTMLHYSSSAFSAPLPLSHDWTLDVLKVPLKSLFSLQTLPLANSSISTVSTNKSEYKGKNRLYSITLDNSLKFTL